MSIKLFNNQSTLLSRVRLHILVLTTVLFLIFSLMTIFIIYSLEDAVFKDQLQQGYTALKTGEHLTPQIKLTKESSTLDIGFGEQLKYLEFEDNFGEFEKDTKHFHFMKTEFGILIIDTTDLSIMSRAIDDILLIMLIISIPSLILTYWISTKISAQALKPFTQLHQAVLTDVSQLTTISAVLSKIEEQDVKFVAEQLVNALEQKVNLLEEQIVFNQGMAHEIRTPLQVMSHSVELIAEANQQVEKQPAFARLTKGIARMNRISTALLWLTSTDQKSHSTEVKAVIDNILSESSSLLAKHNVEICIEDSTSDKALKRTPDNVTLLLPMPEEVVELIVLNLLTNVIHHCHTGDEHKQWLIQINSHSVSFTNPLIATDSSIKQKGFGLGLNLVTKISEKFSVNCQVEQQDDCFKVRFIV